MLFVGGGLISVGELKTDGDITLYVKTNGVHTDICLPVQSSILDWKTIIPVSDYPNNTYSYISIGWGDKGFFLDTPKWSDLTFNTAMNAAFFRAGTAIHVEYLKNAPLVSHVSAKVFIDNKEYQNLIDFIKNSFKMTDNHVELIPNKGYWKTDNFYEANGNYHLFNTCNAWTNCALKKAGVKTGLYVLSSEGIMRHFR